MTAAWIYMERKCNMVRLNGYCSRTNTKKETDNAPTSYSNVPLDHSAYFCLSVLKHVCPSTTIRIRSYFHVLVHCESLIPFLMTVHHCYMLTLLLKVIWQSPICVFMLSIHYVKNSDEVSWNNLFARRSFLLFLRRHANIKSMIGSFTHIHAQV